MPQLSRKIKQPLLSSSGGHYEPDPRRKRPRLEPSEHETFDHSPESSVYSDDAQEIGNEEARPDTLFEQKTAEDLATSNTKKAIPREATTQDSAAQRGRRGKERAQTSNTTKSKNIGNVVPEERSVISFDSTPSEPPPPTQEEDDSFFGPRRDKMVYASSQRSSQGYGKPKTNNIHTMTRTKNGPAPRKFRKLATELPETTKPDTAATSESNFRRIPRLQNAQSSPPTYKHRSQAGSEISSVLSSPPPSSPEPQFPSSGAYELQLKALGTAPEHRDLISSRDDEIICPICSAPIPRSFYESFTRADKLGYSRALDFCAAHRSRAAEERMAKLSYPTIDWDNFDKRLKKFNTKLETILSGKVQSRYREDLENKISTGKGRSAMRNPETLATAALTGSISYYGAKGAALMTDYILNHLGRKIRSAAQKDELFAEIGVPGFVRGVLVPELVLLLVQEDFDGCSEEEARRIVEESSDMSDYLDNEVGDKTVDGTGKLTEKHDSGLGSPTANKKHPLSPPSVSSLSELSSDDLVELDETPEIIMHEEAAAPQRLTRSRKVIDVIPLHEN